MNSSIVNHVTKSLYHSDFHSILYEKLLKSFNDVGGDAASDIYNSLETLLSNDKELNQEFNNYIFNESFKINKRLLSKNAKEADNYLYQTQVAWEKRILKSINTMCSEFQLPLVKKRSDKETKEFIEKWSELSTLNKESDTIRPVYAPKDFLEILIKIENRNSRISSSSETNSWMHSHGLLQIPIRVKTLQELRIQFSEFAMGQLQIGVDDVDKINQHFEQSRQNIAKLLIESKNSAACQEFVKSGCQLEHRRQMWYTILQINVQQSDRHYYNQLKQCVLEYDLLIDSLFFMEVKLTASNDDIYFVFEDYIYQVLLPFSRDTSILKVFEYSTASPAKTYIRGKNNNEDFAVFYPPSGVIPFHGFSMLVVPLCYFIDDPVELYVTFKDLYLRYFHKLHIISDDPQGILSLCLLFEHLLQTLESDLFFYLRSMGVQPLRFAFKWIMRGFSGFLAADQVLLLWDRIIGYESLELLPLAAISIFAFRKSNLMNVRSQTGAEAVLADLTTLQVIPLLQLTLFSH